MNGEYADRLDLDKKVSEELYEVVVTITEGEAKLTVKNVLNNDGGFGVSPSLQALQPENLGESTRSRTPWGPFPWTSAGYTIRSRMSVSNRKMSELSP